MARLHDYMDKNFDDSAVKASTGVPEPIPAGDYTLQVDSTDVSPTKDGTGALLKVEVSVALGEFEGRKIFPQFNILNKSMQAQQIGIGELKALCLACGIEYDAAKEETNILVGRPFHARVGFDKQQINEATGELRPLRNNIKKYHPAGGEIAAPMTAAKSPAPATSAPAVSPTAWRKAS